MAAFADSNLEISRFGWDDWATGWNQQFYLSCYSSNLVNALEARSGLWAQRVYAEAEAKCGPGSLNHFAHGLDGMLYAEGFRNRDFCGMLEAAELEGLCCETNPVFEWLYGNTKFFMGPDPQLRKVRFFPSIGETKVWDLNEQNYNDYPSWGSDDVGMPNSITIEVTFDAVVHSCWYTGNASPETGGHYRPVEWGHSGPICWEKWKLDRDWSLPQGPGTVKFGVRGFFPSSWSGLGHCSDKYGTGIGDCSEFPKKIGTLWVPSREIEEVSSDQGWENTDEWVEGGEGVEISATGSVNLTAGSIQPVSCGPEGVPESICGPGCPLPNAPWGALIARFGQLDDPFFAGAELSTTAPAPGGYLYFAVNDFNYSDNEGSFSAIAAHGPIGADDDDDTSAGCPDCEIDLRCYDDGQVNPDNPCEYCDLSIAADEWTPKPDGAPCDDRMWCSVGDACLSGHCGVRRDCSNGVFCDGPEYCDELRQGCLSTGVAACADDGLFCNGIEQCDENDDMCLHVNEPCDPGFVCDEETDECVPAGDDDNNDTGQPDDDDDNDATDDDVIDDDQSPGDDDDDDCGGCSCSSKSVGQKVSQLRQKMARARTLAKPSDKSEPENELCSLLAANLMAETRLWNDVAEALCLQFASSLRTELVARANGKPVADRETGAALACKSVIDGFEAGLPAESRQQIMGGVLEIFDTVVASGNLTGEDVSQVVRQVAVETCVCYLGE